MMSDELFRTTFRSQAENDQGHDGGGVAEDVGGKEKW